MKSLVFRLVPGLFLFALPLLAAQDLAAPIALTTPRTHGSQVVQLQKKLLEFGFVELGEADGYFGPKSAEAVKGVQRFFGFVPNGIADPQLWKSLFSPGTAGPKVPLLISQANAVLRGSFSLTDKELNGLSTEGGTLTEFRQGGKVRYLELRLLGETGQLQGQVPLVPGGFVLLLTKYAYPAPFDVEHSQLSYLAYYAVGSQYLRIVDGVATEVSRDEVPALQVILNEVRSQ